MSEPYYSDATTTLYHGQALATLSSLPSGSVDCIVTSPPYFGLRDYGVAGQIGAESSPAEFVAALVAVFREARRVLADDGTLWLNLGDSYVSKPAGVKGVSGSSALHGARTSAKYRETLESGHGQKRDTTGMGLAEKNLLGIPWRVAFALQDDGWILRNDIIWAKPNGMPESVTDRLSTKHEHLFLFAKSRRYWFDLTPIREPAAFEYGARERVTEAWSLGTGLTPHNGTTQVHADGRNPGDVWAIPTQPFSEAHFAVFPLEIPRRAIAAGCKPGGVVLDPFSGSGTTGKAAAELGRRYVGIDISSDYLDLSLKTRLAQPTLTAEASA